MGLGGGRAPSGPAGSLGPRNEPMIARADLRCSSCGRGLAAPGATAFLCPSCGTETIGRDARCRDQSVPYKCKNCGFVGP